MKSETRICVSRENNRFAAAHFLVEMGKCEQLHGHNYRLIINLGGSPGPDDTIIDFHTLTPYLASLCSKLDHKILIAEFDKRQKLRDDGNELEIRFGEKRYIFPRAECVVLPVTSTTVEKMAEYLADELSANLSDKLPNVEWIEVGLAEGSGQEAFYRRAIR